MPIRKPGQALERTVPVPDFGERHFPIAPPRSTLKEDQARARAGKQVNPAIPTGGSPMTDEPKRRWHDLRFRILLLTERLFQKLVRRETCRKWTLKRDAQGRVGRDTATPFLGQVSMLAAPPFGHLRRIAGSSAVATSPQLQPGWTRRRATVPLTRSCPAASLRSLGHSPAGPAASRRVSGRKA